MTWVNLNDVYVSKNGGTISGDLAVNGTLTINDKKGTGTTYDVANQISTLRDSVSRIDVAGQIVTFRVRYFDSCCELWFAAPDGNQYVLSLGINNNNTFAFIKVDENEHRTIIKSF